MAVGGFLIRTLHKQETRWASLASGFFVGCEGLFDVLAKASAQTLSYKPFRLSLGTHLPSSLLCIVSVVECYESDDQN